MEEYLTNIVQSGGGVIAYGTSKWAVRGLTQATAMELGQHNINVSRLLYLNNDAEQSAGQR
jgi:NAD(P)-dependent dehydrogenase (short-subunit alcohol dehydrogenase family)